MAVISGVNGAVYWNEELTSIAIPNSISFSAENEIISSTDNGAASSGILNFVNEGYKEGMLITLSDAVTTGNNRTFTIVEPVTSGTITVSSGEGLVASTGDASTGITFLEAEPGYPEAGFYNWAINYKVDLLDKTNFDTSSGGRSYIASIKDWTAKADKYFLSTGNAVNDWLGDTVKARFFINYVATPSTGDASHYYEGNTIVTGIDIGTPVDALITQGISFQGVGTLTPTTRTWTWNTTG